MATLKELYDLVQSLDKSEKKYVSQMIEGTAGKARDRYAKSFRIINSTARFDEENLRIKLNRNVYGMNLSEANTNLFNFVCRSIVAYHGAGDGNIGLQNELLLVEILGTKGLYETAHKMLQPVAERLERKGTFAMQHRAHELQGNISIHYRKLNFDYATRYKNYEARLEIIDKHRQFVEITMLNMQFFELAQKTGDARSKSQFQQYVKLAAHPLLQLPFSAVNIRSLATFTTLKLALQNVAHPEYDIFELCREARAELHKRVAPQDFPQQDYYVVDLMIAEAIHLRERDIVTECIKELKHLHGRIANYGQQQKILTRILMAELTLCNWDKDYVRFEKLLKDWMSERKKGTWINANLSYVNLLLAARIYYLAGKPDKALDYLLMLQEREKIMRPSVHIGYRFLFLLCHYKLRNYEFLTYATESLYRLLLKMDKLYAPEKALLRFVKRCDHFDKVQDELKILATEFDKLQHDTYNKSFFAFGDYKEWLSGELKRR